MDSKRRSSEQSNNCETKQSADSSLSNSSKRKSPSLDTLSMRRQRQAQQQQVLNAQRRFLQQMIGESSADLSATTTVALKRCNSSTDCNNNSFPPSAVSITESNEPNTSVRSCTDVSTCDHNLADNTLPGSPNPPKMVAKDSARPRTTQDSRALLMAIMSRHRLGHIRLPCFDPPIDCGGEAFLVTVQPDDAKQVEDQVRTSTDQEQVDRRTRNRTRKSRGRSMDKSSIGDPDDSDRDSFSRRSSLFSRLSSLDDSLDVELDEDSLICSSVPTEVINEREKRRSAGYPGLAFGGSLFGSNTMMRFRIISNELHNIQNVQLKRVRLADAMAKQH
jgi:hypothetical protein